MVRYLRKILQITFNMKYSLCILLSAASFIYSCGSPGAAAPTGIYTRTDSNRHHSWTDSIIIEPSSAKNTYKIRINSDLKFSSPEYATASYDAHSGVLDMPGLKIVIDPVNGEAHINDVSFKKIQ